MQKVCLDLHDFSVVNNRLDLLLKLKGHFPNFKVSLFTVACDKKEDWGASLVREDFLKVIKENLDWLQIIPHALHHGGSEVSDISYKEFGFLLTHMGLQFDADGLPFVNGFCPPHWRWNEDVVKVLDEKGWWGAIDRDKIMPRPKRFYQYNYLLNESFPLDTDLRLHGHIYGTKNDLGRCFSNLTRLHSDTEFVFATDCLEGIE
jgi:hypothetical protein